MKTTTKAPKKKVMRAKKETGAGEVREVHVPVSPTIPAYFPPEVMTVLQKALDFHNRLALLPTPTAAPDYLTTPLAEDLSDFEMLVHEKALVDEISYLLKRRSDELKNELGVALEMSGVEKAAVRGAVCGVVKSHTSRIDGEKLLRRGVAVADIEAATVKTDYSYVKVTMEKQKGEER